MNSVTLILLGAGNSTRFGLGVKKQWLYIGKEPLWHFVTQKFLKYNFSKIIIVSSLDDIKYMKNFGDYTYVEGGSTRQESLQNALAHVTSEYVLVSDIARCCIDHAMIQRVLEKKEEADCVVPVLPLSDTLYFVDNPVDREQAKLIQTPQLSKTSLLQNALLQNEVFTDDSSAMHQCGYKIISVQGSTTAHKLTFQEDLKKLSCLKPPIKTSFIGFGIDTHAFEDAKPMYLCGVKIQEDFGFLAHSDGDVAIHAIIDALLGAAGLGDIGEFFPDTDVKYHGIDSKELLKSTLQRLNAFGFVVENIDLTIVAQTPKINPHKEAMRESLSSIVGIAKRYINVKATTSEKLGFIGRCEGISVHAVASIGIFDWTNI